MVIVLQLPVVERSVTPAKSSHSEHASRAQTPNEDAKSSPSKSGTPSGRKKIKEQDSPSAEQSAADIAPEEKKIK